MSIETISNHGGLRETLDKKQQPPESIQRRSSHSTVETSVEDQAEKQLRYAEEQKQQGVELVKFDREHPDFGFDADTATGCHKPSENIEDINARLQRSSIAERARLKLSHTMVQVFGRLLNFSEGQVPMINSRTGKVTPAVFVIRYMRELERGGLTRDLDAERQLQECFRSMNGIQRFCFRMWAKHLCITCSLMTGFALADVPSAILP